MIAGVECPSTSTLTPSTHRHRRRSSSPRAGRAPCGDRARRHLHAAASRCAACTAISPTDHSTGAGVTSTATRAVCGVRRRTAGSGDADVDRFRHRRRRTGDDHRLGDRLRQPSTARSPVRALRPSTALQLLCRPRILGAGSPSTAGTIGTRFAARRLERHRRRVDGFTCTTSTPNGARTSPPPR